MACLTKYKRLINKTRATERGNILMILLEHPCWEVKVNGDPPTCHMEIHMTPPPPIFSRPRHLNNERSLNTDYLLDHSLISPPPPPKKKNGFKNLFIFILLSGGQWYNAILLSEIDGPLVRGSPEAGTMLCP